MVDATSVPGCDQSGLSSAASSTATTPSATASAQDASDNVPTPSMSSLPPSLADLQNPATFSIQPSPKHGRKITKASFFDPSRPALGETAGDALEGSADPLSRLDPLWSLKPTGTSRDSAEEMEQSWTSHCTAVFVHCLWRPCETQCKLWSRMWYHSRQWFLAHIPRLSIVNSVSLPCCLFAHAWMHPWYYHHSPHCE